MELFCVVSLITVIVVFDVMTSCNLVGSHGATSIQRKA
jgi:hypothetical protein